MTLDSDNSHPDSNRFEPAFPTLIALGILGFWIVILSLPMLNGQYLAGPFSDQYATGYAFRHWGAEQWRNTGSIPLWNPLIFGGMPFVAAMHGDIFYPTAWLRLVFPTTAALNLGFFIHYILAGFFTYAFLRRLRVAWSGCVVGGLSYQLSGVIATYVQPGHDGKLYVTALLPLALLALVLALRERRFEGYALFAGTVGLGLLSPHFQMMYYLLLVAGLFALYLTFGEPDQRTISEKFAGLGLALAAVIIGFGVAMIQILPFLDYLPFSPRAEGYGGFEDSASYAIPWSHVGEFFLAGFVGDRTTYWGANPLKLHSEYLGLSVLALAVLGALGNKRHLVIWLGSTGLLLLLVALGSSTPFYRLWWEVMPFVKQTRAPGMALYVVSFVLAVLAALGVERVELRHGVRHATAWIGIGGVIALLGAVGAFGALAESFAQGGELATARLAQIEMAREGIRWGAVSAGLGLVIVGVLAALYAKGKIALGVLGLLTAGVVSADLWRNARSFWVYSDVQNELFAGDEIVQHLQGSSEPYRVFDMGFFARRDAYPGSSLMAQGVPQLFGHHGNELRHFDELWGGKNRWVNFGNTNLWDLYAIDYLLVPSGIPELDSIPGYTPVSGYVRTSAGVPTRLYERNAVKYARLVPGGIKLPESQIIPTILSPRFSADLVVVFDESTDVQVESLSQLPDPFAVEARVEDWEPGRMRITLQPAAPRDGYLLVSENYYPDWRAMVDDVDVPVYRGDHSLITVPVSAGARSIELRFESDDYRTGRRITFASVLIVLLGGVAPLVRGRSRG